MPKDDVETGAPSPKTGRSPEKAATAFSCQEDNKQEKPPSAAILVLAVLAAFVAGGAAIWYSTRDHVSTDDAFIEARIATISPQISGRIARVLVGDNQHVREGDLLVEFDTANLELALRAA